MDYVIQKNIPDNVEKLINKIKSAQQNLTSENQDIKKMFIDLIKDISVNICNMINIIYDNSDTIDTLLYKIEKNPIIPENIKENFKKIKNLLSEINQEKTSQENINFGLGIFHYLTFILEWFFRILLRMSIPEDLREFFIINKEPVDLKLKKDSKDIGIIESAEKEQFSITNFLLNYKVPDFIHRLVFLQNDIKTLRDRDQIRKSIEEINSIYENIGINDEITKACFQILCNKMDQSKKPVKYKTLLNAISQWSVTNAAKNIPNFPTTELSIASAVDNLINILNERNLLIEQAFNHPDKLIGLRNLDAATSKKEINFVNSIIKYISSELEKVRLDPTCPFPSYNKLKAEFDRNKVSIDMYVTIMDSYIEITNESKEAHIPQTPFVAFDYHNPDKDKIVITKEFYKKVPEVVISKLYNFFKIQLKDSINNMSSMVTLMNRINMNLKKQFPTDTKDFSKFLEFDYINIKDLWTKNDPYLEKWLFIFNDLNSNLENLFDHNQANQKTVMQSISLMTQMLIERREVQFKEKLLQELNQELIKKISSQEKVDEDVIRSEWLKAFPPKSENKEMIDKAFNDFLQKFLESYSLFNSPQNFVINLPIFNPRTQQEDNYYVHSSWLLYLYKKNLDILLDKNYGIKQNAFIKKASEVIDLNIWSSDIEKVLNALENENNFVNYIMDYIKLFHHEFYILDNLFTNNVDMLRYLIQEKNENINYYFNRDGTKKNVLQFLNFTREDIIKIIRSKCGFISFIINILINLFPYFYKNISPRQLLYNKINLFYAKMKGLNIYYNQNLEKKTLKSKPKSNIDKSTKAADTYDNYKKSKKTRDELGKVGSKSSELEKKKIVRIQELKKELLDMEGMSSEEEYLDYFLKKWSLRPKDDIEAIKYILTKKRGDQLPSWLNTIKKDIQNIETLDDYMEIMRDVAKAVLLIHGRKSINPTYLAKYLAMFILKELE